MTTIRLILSIITSLDQMEIKIIFLIGELELLYMGHHEYFVPKNLWQSIQDVPYTYILTHHWGRWS